MEIIINEQTYQYTSDFPDGWKFSSGDPFKFPVQIGRHSCFVKLFRKPVAKITGWDLLVRLKGKNSRNIPRIHDIKESEINGGEVHYVFYEYLAGENLDHLIARGEALDLDKLASGIFAALSSIHSSGYWFADFCEKNIYRDSSGRFILLDLDSCIPLSVPPRTDALGNKDYWSPVFHFYRDMLNYTQISTEDLPGNYLNILQLYLMIFRIQKFYLLPKDQRNYTGLLNKLHLLLLDAVPGAASLFQQVFPSFDPAEYGYIPETGFLAYTGLILHPVVAQETVEPASPSDPKPAHINNVDPVVWDPKPRPFEAVIPEGLAKPEGDVISSSEVSPAGEVKPTAEEITPAEPVTPRIWDPKPMPLAQPAQPLTTEPTAIEPAATEPAATEHQTPVIPITPKPDPIPEPAQAEREEVAAMLPPLIIAADVAAHTGTTAASSAGAANITGTATTSTTSSAKTSPNLTRQGSWRLFVGAGVTAVAIAAASLVYLKAQTDKKEVQELQAVNVKALAVKQLRAAVMIPVTLSPDTLVLVARQFEAVSMSVAAGITSISDVSVTVDGKAVPPNLISLKPAKDLSLVTIFIDSTYHSGDVRINYPGMTIAAKALTIVKIKNRIPRHFHTPVVVNLDEEKRRLDSEAAARRVDSARSVRKPENEALVSTHRVRAITATYFEFNRGEGLMHKIFSKKQYLIRGHNFLAAKNGFEVFDMHERLEVKIESDSILVVRSPRKVHALLLKLLPRGSADTLWVRGR